MASETSIANRPGERNSAPVNWRKVIKLEYEKLNKKFDCKKSTDIR